MKYVILAKNIISLPALKWLNAIFPSTVKDWLITSDKSLVPLMNNSQDYSDKLKHPAESRIVRVNDMTPKP